MARGIVGYGVYLPFRRLDRSEIAAVAGTGGGKGTRTVASYDEDTTTMGVAAARAVWGAGGAHALWFATTTPAYADKTNATAIHAALGLDPSVPAFDVNGAVRSAVGALRAGLAAPEPALVVTADMRSGLPGSADEATGGDAAAALLVGEGTPDTPVLAELVASGSATAEFLDRWRAPGDLRSKVWEERFGERHYVDLARRAWDEAVKGEDVDRVVAVGSHGRAVSSFLRSIGPVLGPDQRRNDELDTAVGFTGAAHPALALAAALDEAEPGEVIALVVLADGADVLLFRTTEALAERRPRRTVADQVAGGGPISYGRYLAWRGILPIEPPRRPEPARPSASAAGRNTAWKFGLVASQADGTSRPMADATGTIVTFTIDRLAYSPSPPVVFAVVDFDGGGRLPVELTDVDPGAVQIGQQVEMTFRKLFTADGIHNYFWKARAAGSGKRPKGRVV